MPKTAARSRSRKSEKSPDNYASKVVRGKLVKYPMNTIQVTNRWRFNSLVKPKVQMKKRFEFKVFTNVRDILDYLGLISYLHLFNDNKLSAVSEFYHLDEFALKKILVPHPVRQ